MKTSEILQSVLAVGKYLESNPPKPITNADRIRAMTDEELCDEYFRILNYELWKYTDSRQGLLHWMKQEAE